MLPLHLKQRLKSTKLWRGSKSCWIQLKHDRFSTSHEGKAETTRSSQIVPRFQKHKRHFEYENERIQGFLQCANTVCAPVKDSGSGCGFSLDSRLLVSSLVGMLSLNFRNLRQACYCCQRNCHQILANAACTTASASCPSTWASMSLSRSQQATKKVSKMKPGTRKSAVFLTSTEIMFFSKLRKKV